MEAIQKQRCDELHKLGLKFNGQSYITSGVEVHHTDILCMNDKQWSDTIESIKKVLPKKQVLVFMVDDKEIDRQEQETRLSNGAILFTLWEFQEKHKIPSSKNASCRIDIENDGIYAGTVFYKSSTTQAEVIKLKK